MADLQIDDAGACVRSNCGGIAKDTCPCSVMKSSLGTAMTVRRRYLKVQCLMQYGMHGIVGV